MKKENIIIVGRWLLIAFLVGFFLSLGSRTLHYIWPEKPVQIDVMPMNKHRNFDSNAKPVG